MRAVRGMSYTVHAGETLAIVGESGSGKSVSSLAVMGLLPGNAAITGQIRFKGEELLDPERQATFPICGAAESRWSSRIRCRR